MPYSICSVPWLVICTIQLPHVLPMIIYHLAYCELLFLSMEGLTVYGFNQILQICACRMIGGD